MMILVALGLLFAGLYFVEKQPFRGAVALGGVLLVLAVLMCIVVFGL